jgi:3D (Asp-Asp-Asp) domain-containing protein
MNARKTHLSTIIKLTGVASLVLFVGAAVPKQPAITAPAIKPAKVAVAKAAATLDNSAELLHDATPAAATIAPSVPAVRVLRMEVTAYCPCTKCCGPNAQGITASGHDVSYNNSKFVAADTAHLPFGTKLIIPGYDAAPVEVIDRGGAIKGMKLDLYYPTHEEALQWGRQWVDVVVVD